jgi:MraZ protein
LVALTEAEFQAQADKVRALPPSNPAVMDFKRFFIAPAITLVVDKAGRVSVPKELRDFAGLEREVIWAGVLDRMELWSKTRWDDTNARRLQSAEEREKTRQELERYGL